MRVEDIQTRFVRDRIRGRSWEEREYVADLISLERLEIDGHLGFAAALAQMPEQLRDRYPAEAECIRRELREGHYTDPKEFERCRDPLAAACRRQREKERAEARRQKREQQRQEREKQEAARRAEVDAWIRLGGLP